MSSKGVTPVIATVLLMGISVGAAFAAYSFVSNTQTQTQENYEKKLRQQELEEQTAIDIERVYRSSGDYAFLFIRNIGSRPITIEENGNRYLSMFVDGKPVGETAQDWKYVGPTVSRLDSGSTLTLNSTQKFPTSGYKEFEVSVRYGANSVHRCAASEGSPC